MLLEKAASEVPSANEYILHHITFLSNRQAQGIIDFSVVNWDSVFFSVLLAVVFGGVFYAAARKAHAGVPSKFLNFIELVVEKIGDQVKDVFHGDARVVAPLALTIFCWVLLFNLMDVVPVDLLPGVAHTVGFAHLKVVPSTDVNITFGLSLTVLLLIVYYSIKMKGPLGYAKELLFHPFGPWLLPFNLLLGLVEIIAKPISLALRLFGNMYAGEMVFLLIALMTLSAGVGSLTTVGGWKWVVIQVVLGVIWAGFDTFVALLQAFIFMVLTVVYLSQAHQHDQH